MTNAWDKASDLADRHANQGGIFIRLASNGDKVVGTFCSEPHAREVHWTGEKYEECQGDGCPHCGAGKRPSLRVMLNFFVTAEGEMKIIEGGTNWFKDVLKVKKKYGLEKWQFEIERHGEAGDPKTTYSILPEEKIDDELRARVAAADLHILGDLGGGDDGDSQSCDTKPATSGGAIDPPAAGELVALLKSLPRSDVDAFLAEFKVQRVRDLRAVDEDGARAFIERLTTAQPGGGEIDPFA